MLVTFDNSGVTALKKLSTGTQERFLLHQGKTAERIYLELHSKLDLSNLYIFFLQSQGSIILQRNHALWV